MLLSTSSSDNTDRAEDVAEQLGRPSSADLSKPASKGVGSARLDRFTLIVLATVVVILAAAEWVSSVEFDRISQVQRREMAQRRALLAVNDSTTAEYGHVAVVGNSLLLEGLNVPLLTEKIGSRFAPVPYFVLATGYYDWLFGLRRLFAEGMRPRFVVLGLSPNQLASPVVRGDYSSRYLFQSTDLPEVARRVNMDPTMTSGLILAHFSEFYSTRQVIRRYLLSRLLPGVSSLLHTRFGSERAPEIDGTSLRQLAAERLPELERLCQANGSHFVLVIPPSYQKGAETIAQIGAEQGVKVMVPITTGTLDATYYGSDGFHLNDKGAQAFTLLLAEKLSKELTRR